LGLEELISTLKKNEQKQIDDIWQTVQSEADALRKQVADEIAATTKKHTDQLASACQRSMRSIYSDTEIKTREKKLISYQALDQALRNTAVKKLPSLRQGSYSKVFADLVAELPQRKWENIVVNPADLEMAAKYFSADIIYPDEAISGGLIATTAEGRIIVDNSFEKRLERKWFQIFPAIITELEKRYGKARSAENTE